MNAPRSTPPTPRFRGHRGGLIEPHRSLLVLPVRPLQAVLATALVLAFVAAWIAISAPVAEAWAAIARFCVEVLGLPVRVGLRAYPMPWGAVLEIPRLDAVIGEPGPAEWWFGAFFVAAVLAVSFLLPRRWLPLSYFLRLTAFVQAGAQLQFFAFPGAFPYDTGGYTEVLFLASLALIGLVPVQFGLTYFTLDFRAEQHVAAVVLTMAHLFLFVPLQWVAHVALLQAGSLLWMPLLFWMGGLSVDVAVVIAIYGWAASWRPRDWKPPRRVAFVLALLGTVVGAVPAARAADRQWGIEVGTEFGDYTEGLGRLDGQFVALHTERPWIDHLRLEIGRAARFGDEGLGVGLLYGRHLSRHDVLSVGVAAGGGDVIQPDLRLDLGWRHLGLLDDRLIFDLGYTHLESKGENSSDGVGSGIVYRLGGRWSVGVDGRVDVGQPGSTTGHTLAASLLYGIYKRFYAHLRAETGRVAYTLVGTGSALVEYDSQGVRAGASLYLREDRGVSAEFSWLDTEVYDLRSVSLRLFRNW